MLLVTSTRSFGINVTGLFIIVYVGFICVVYGRLVAEVLYTSEGGQGQSVTSCRGCADLALFRLLGSQGVNGRGSIFYCALQSSKVPFSRIIVSYIAREYNVDQRWTWRDESHDKGGVIGPATFLKSSTFSNLKTLAFLLRNGALLTSSRIVVSYR